MKRGKPGEAQAQALAERKAKWDADAPKRAEARALFQPLSDAHDAEELLRAGRSAKARCRIDEYVEDEWIQGIGEYSAWDCEAGAAGSGGFGAGGGYRHIEISR
jgi:hypothetical protein